MPKLSPVQDLSAFAVAPVQEPGVDAVRAYAYYLYQQAGGAPGHDLDNWLEATACLKANIADHSARLRLNLPVNGPAKAGQLVTPPAMAKREVATLRRERDRLEGASGAAELDVRTSLFDDRP